MPPLRRCAQRHPCHLLQRSGVLRHRGHLRLQPLALPMDLLMWSTRRRGRCHRRADLSPRCHRRPSNLLSIRHQYLQASQGNGRLVSPWSLQPLLHPSRSRRKYRLWPNRNHRNPRRVHPLVFNHGLACIPAQTLSSGYGLLLLYRRLFLPPFLDQRSPRLLRPQLGLGRRSSIPSRQHPPRPSKARETHLPPRSSLRNHPNP